MTFNEIKGVFDDRVEQLFVSTDYKLFVRTGQKTWEYGGRNALAVRAFNSVDTAAKAALNLEAIPFVTGDDSDLTISFNKAQNCLTIVDKMVGTYIDVPVNTLDKDVQEKIRAEDIFLQETGLSIKKASF